MPLDPSPLSELEGEADGERKMGHRWREVSRKRWEKRKGKVGEETGMRNVERENREKRMRQEKIWGYQRKSQKGL